MKINPILNSDSYKCSHWQFYPEGTTHVYSYMESRGGEYERTLFFGLQGLIKEYLMTPITLGDILEAESFAKVHGVPFNKAGWMHILTKHKGFFPVEIKAVPEGTVVNAKNVLMTVRNTDPAVPFITSYIETMALRLWYPITVATRTFYMKKRIQPYFEMTSESEFMDFAVLDFSARGCTSYEANMIGGAAYLVNFAGSDSMSAVRYVQYLYGGSILGYSVSATEHSIMCSYGQENEFESFERMLDVAEEGSILSVVSDTWNIYEAAKKWCKLADKVKAKNMTLVVRPDSGEIDEVLPQVLTILEAGFGSTLNKKGFKVLNNVKVLWGDGINEFTVARPFAIAHAMGISSDSIITGSGGGLMQVDINRDTNKFAFKASCITVNGEDRAIAKDPITDPGKMSKKGFLALVEYVDGTFSTAGLEGAAKVDVLRTVYLNGELIVDETMETVRERTKYWLTVA
jgi:nicotinamide phosphoribosyltransferase